MAALTEAQRALLKEVYGWEHLGGYWTEDRSLYRRLERLRARGLLRYLTRRKKPFYNTFFEVTTAGYVAISPAMRETGGPRS